MTNNALTLRRIVKARRAMMNAQNPEFQLYWYNVMSTLESKLVTSHG